MMKTNISAALILLAVAATASAQDKKELRYRFEKGQTFTLSMQNSTKLKITELPEAFQGLLAGDPIDLTFEGDASMEVTGVKDGKAQLRGTWKSMKVKGTLMMMEIDFDHGRAAAGEKEEKPEVQPGAPGLEAFGDPEAQFRKLAETPLELEVDGRSIAIKGMSSSDFSSQFFMFMGIAGPLPEEAKGPGDTWDSSRKITLPSMQGTLDLEVKSKNTYTKDLKADGRDCAVLASKFVVGTPKAKKEGDGAADALAPKVKVEGKGEGTTLFAHGEGRPAGANNTLKIDVDAQFQDPAGGGEMSLKAALQVRQEYQFSR